VSPLERHQLVWLRGAAWQQIRSQPWEPEATEILAHWHAQQSPLMVTRQRTATAPDQVCLGLPAPAQWGRRKLSLQVDVPSITTTASCPSLTDVAPAQSWRDAALELDAKLLSHGVAARVYGSYAWQHLTSLSYVHSSSDVDLHLDVHDLDQATWVIEQLAHAPLLPRLDGELIFPGGAAVAWRECLQLIQGQVSEVLMKDLHHLRLVTASDLRALCATGAP